MLKQRKRRATVRNAIAAVALVATAVALGTSLASAAVANTAAPSIVAGSYRVGSTLYANPGTWSGNPTSYTYQWRKCKLDPTLTCVDIAGETGPTHVVTQADTIWNQAGFLPERSFMYGIRLQVVVTASDGASSASATSTTNHQTPSVTTAAIAGTSQTFGAPPAGVPEIDGAIPSPPSCVGNSGPICINPLGWYIKIAGRYPLPEGGTLQAFSAYFRGGSAAQTFYPAVWNTDQFGEPTRLVVRGLPITIPALAAPGWFSASLESPVAVPAGTYFIGFVGGATDRGADPYFYIPAQSIGVSNTNLNLQEGTPGFGEQTFVPSDGFGPVAHYAGEIPKAYVTYTPTSATASAPGNTGAPGLTGSAQAGQQLTATNGAWSGSPTAYAYQWQRCNASGSGCADIVGQAAAAYTVGAGDVGGTLRVLVRAANAAGISAPAASSVSAVVTAGGGGGPAAPVNSALPTISGTAQAGQILGASTGTWLNGPTSYGYQWQKCNSAGAACSPIGLATAASYTVAAGDVGSTLRVVVTATNAVGPGTATSAATAVVTAAGSGGSGSTGGTTGGSGGGSGGANPDLAVTQTASAATAAAGDTILYVIRVQVANPAATSGASNVVLTDTLPAGTQLVGTKVNRGGGCVGTTVLTCNLDFLSGSLVAQVELTVRVVTAGTLVNTASVTASQSDPNTANNTSSSTVSPPPAPAAPLAPPTVVRAPKLSLAAKQGTTARAVVKGKLATVTASVKVGGKGTLTLVALEPRSGIALRLQKGTTLGTTTLARAAGIARTTVGAAGTVQVKAILPASFLQKGKAYALRVAAGTGSTLTIRFVG